MWVAQRQVLSIRSRIWRAAAGDAGGDVQHPVAEGGDLAAGERGVSAKAISLVQAIRSVAVSTTSSQAAFSFQARQGRFRSPVALACADAVLDAGVLAVAQLQPGELAGHDPGRGVGEERGDPMPVDVGEGQLGAGVGAFLAQDQPGARRARRTGRAGR